MAYSIGEKVIYNSISGKKEEATIVARKVDFKKGTIETWNASGNFDYLISVEKNGKIEEHFCEEIDLE